MSKEFFILGFTKQAEAYGLINSENKEKIAELINEHYENYLNKTADDLNLKIPLPSAEAMSTIKDVLPFMAGTTFLGAGIGSNYAPLSNQELRDELEYSETPSVSKFLKYLVPGYAGYRLAKEHRLNQAYQKYLNDNNR